MYGSYWLRSAVLALAYFHFAKAHMRMSSPPPIRSPEEGVNVDFDQTSPLGVYPCKGFHTLPGHSSVMNIAAGSTIPVTITGGASHGGGSCQFSLSYDQGQTFKVVHSVIGGCPLQPSYNVPIPAGAQSGEALFAWTWNNRLAGQPYLPFLSQIDRSEFYMNCAKVTITNGGSGFSGPDVFVANLPAVNNVKTVLGMDVIYPDPGNSVEFGGDGKTAPPVGVVVAGAGSGSGSGAGAGAGGSQTSVPLLVGGPTTMKTVAGTALTPSVAPKKLCGRKKMV